MRLMDNATRTSEKRNSHNFFWKNLNQMEHLPEPRAGVEWTTILKWILKKSVGRAKTGVIRLRMARNVEKLVNLRVP